VQASAVLTINFEGVIYITSRSFFLDGVESLSTEKKKKALFFLEKREAKCFEAKFRGAHFCERGRVLDGRRLPRRSNFVQGVVLSGGRAGRDRIEPGANRSDFKKKIVLSVDRCELGMADAAKFVDK